MFKILALILNFMISESSPIVKSSDTWNLKKNFPIKRWLSITFVLIDSITTASRDGCLNLKFSYSTFRYTNTILSTKILTEREKLFEMIYSFSRLARSNCIYLKSRYLSISWLMSNRNLLWGYGIPLTYILHLYVHSIRINFVGVLIWSFIFKILACVIQIVHLHRFL